MTERPGPAIPQSADAADRAFDLARRLEHDGRGGDAEDVYRRILAATPDHGPTLHRLGVLLVRAARVNEALRLLGRAAELEPTEPRRHLDLGIALHRARRYAAAEATFRRALALAPDLAEAQAALGATLHALDRSGEAVAALRDAVVLRPDAIALRNRLAALLLGLGWLDEAEPACRAALDCDPRSAAAHNHLGVLLRDLGRCEEAAQAFHRAVALAPDEAEAHANLGACLLALGRFREGWPEFEWRLRVPRFAHPGRRSNAAAWTGAPIAEGTLLLRGEQGLGEQILAASMIPDAMTLAPRCVLECEPRLRPIFARSFPAIETVPWSDPPHPRTRAPDIAFRCQSLGLGRWLRTDVADFPPRSSYLVADAAHAARLRARYRALGPGPVIGIAWRSRSPRLGPARTTAIEDWLPILRLPGAVFVNLQYGDCAGELAALRERHGIAVHGDAEIDQLRDLDAFAAQVAALDLVIATANTTVHVAGALGRPVWTLLPEGPGLLWYWFLARADSPWYPTMRLFRQDARGAWAPLIARVAAALAGFAVPLRS